MADNYGKKFEACVKEGLEASFPKEESITIRIPDQQSKYKGTSSNICDILSFYNGRLYLVEAKSTHETTFNFARLTQYDDLLKYKDVPNAFPIVVVWFIELDTIVVATINEIERMKLGGMKSIHPKWLETNEYKLYRVPATKKRKFFKCDFKFLETITKE